MTHDPVVQITFTTCAYPPLGRIERLTQVIRASFQELGRPLKETQVNPRDIATLAYQEAVKETRTADFSLFIATESFWNQSRLTGFKVLADTEYYSLYYRHLQKFHPQPLFMLYTKEPTP